jgi:hypothetical protein
MDARQARLLDELTELARRAQAIAGVETIIARREQYDSVDRAIAALERAGAPVSDDLRRRERELAEQLDRANEALRALDALRRAIQPLAETLGYRLSERGPVRSRRRPAAVPSTLQGRLL